MEYISLIASSIIRSLPAWLLLFWLAAAPLPASAQTSPSPYTVYADQLASGWREWSWDVTVNYQLTSPLLAGTYSMSITPSRAWAGWGIQTDVPVDGTKYGYLALSAQMTASNPEQYYGIYLMDCAGNVFSDQGVQFFNYGGQIPVGSWKEYRFPLTAFEAFNKPICGIRVIDFVESASTLYLDNIRFEGLPPSPTPTLPPLPPNPDITRAIFRDEMAAGWSDASWDITQNPRTSSPVHSGLYSFSFTPSRAWAGWRMWNWDQPVDGGKYSFFTFAARMTTSSPAQIYGFYFFDCQGNAINSDGVRTDNYGGAIPTDSWKIYKIPLTAFNSQYAQICGLQVVDYQETASTLYLDEIGFGGAVPPTPTITPTPPPLSISFNVNAGKNVSPFSRRMLGMAMVNWEHAWNKPYPNEVPGLVQAMKEIRVGILRYAGGNWANSVGFDRSTYRTPYTEWSKNGITYWFTYGTDELSSLAAFAKNIGAEVIIQVNIVGNDPTMWADMVRYCNIEKGYGFKYWELGNELDIDTANNITPDIYTTRAKAYIDAMKDVDPTIKVILGVPAIAHDAARLGYNDTITSLSAYLTQSAGLVTPKNRTGDSLSYHWYMANNSLNLEDLKRWSWSDLPYTSWRNNYSRNWSWIAPERVKNELIAQHPQLTQGITELNFDSTSYDSVLNGNHLNAVWLTNILPRLAYYGLDYSTWYEGYGAQGYAVIYPDNGDAPTRIMIRPSYYGFYLLANYFGDQLVEVTNPNPEKISVFAAKDSQHPASLRLLISNISENPMTVPINLTGFTASTGGAYVLSSSTPADLGASSNTVSADTNINGVKFDPMNIAAGAAKIVPVPITVSGNSLTYSVKPYSAVAIVLESTSVSPTPGPKPGDANNDNKVDGVDYVIWLGNYGKTFTSPDCVPAKGDFNSSCRVDGVDYVVWLNSYGK